MNYQLMTNEDLGSVPLGQFLNPGALVAVWCTNSESNMETLEKKIFPQWGLDYIGRWFWVKVTKYGDPVCHFNPPPGRQPFEQIVFGKRLSNKIHEDDEKIPWEDGKVIASVPSAIHSHKPPLSGTIIVFIETGLP
ncbi:hypothetical protein J437_LFUL012830 [Ladona fulva]|uniref:Uncharacterized protein n=1 Tax=Ladona fulva TaxID=123851 RepID=A0A8K0KJH7_LADFU|nr:hypothetical protein J437_LFUL012830 [Ladona fulva]